MADLGVGNVVRSSVAPTMMRKDQSFRLPRSLIIHAVLQSLVSNKKTIALADIIVIVKNVGLNQMSGDTNPIRNLGYLTWSDDLAWMESQKGQQWNKAVASENNRFDMALKGLQPKISKFLRSMKRTSEAEHEHAWKWKGWTIKKSEFSPVETWSHGSYNIECWDADVSDSLIAAAIPDKNGYERFTLKVYNYKQSHRPLLEVHQAGPYAAFLKSGTLAYLRSEADHRYNSLWLWSYKTSQHKKLYEISNLTKNLALVRLENGSVAVTINDFVNEEFGFIYETHVEWYKPNTKKALVMAFDHKTVLVNPTGADFHAGLPNDFLEAASKSAGWAVTRSYGIRTLWNTHTKEAKAMIHVWGEITFDTRDPSRISVCDVRYEPYTVIIKDSGQWSLTKTKAHPFVCSYYNTKAPVFVVSSNNPRVQPRGLLVTAYGAYGFPTKIGRLVRRWRPLLESGWTIASVAVPGSGDHDLAWRFAGQRTKRKLAVDTLVAAVRDLQEELGIPAQVTALYGRSAGGLLVTAVVAEDPKLVGALYIESPYVDALRTLTNPRFPLTVLESNEFGIGNNPVDVISLARWSPMERIPAKGYPNLFVVARTDMSDLEVYPYEPLKYVTRVRGLGQSGSQPKLIYISSDQGHFTTTDRTRAEDLALLDEWASSL